MVAPRSFASLPYPCPCLCLWLCLCLGALPGALATERCGEYKFRENQSPCQVCLTNFDNPNATECRGCPIGFYHNDSTSIVRIAENSSFELDKDAECSVCPAGYFSDSIASPNCKICAGGTYQREAGRDSCDACPAGWEQTLTGGIECQRCPNGRYSMAGVNDHACTECPFGQFQAPDAVGQAYCERCASGRITLRNGSGHLNVCAECPEGADCAPGPENEVIVSDSVQALEGWWHVFDADSWVARKCDNPGDQGECRDAVPTFEKCLKPDPHEACPGGLVTTANRSSKCGKGYRDGSRLCASCASNYVTVSSQPGKCAKCRAEGVFLLVLMFVLIMLALVFFVYSSAAKNWNEFKNAKVSEKLLINHLQLISLAASLRAEWPGPLRSFFGIAAASSSGVSDQLDISCFLSSDVARDAANITYLRLVMVGVFPILVSLGALVILFVLYKNNRLRLFKMQDHCIAAVGLLCYILYPGIVKSALKLVSCVQVDGRYYLVADMEEQCFVGRHLAVLMGLGFPMFLLYVVGLPVAGVWLTRRGMKVNWDIEAEIAQVLKEVPDDGAHKIRWLRAKYHAHQRQLSFRVGIFFMGYSPQTWYWEAIITARKTLIAIVTNVLFFDGSLQVFFVSYVIVLATLAHGWVLPFDLERHNKHELASLVVSFTTFFATYALREDMTSEGWGVAACVLVAVANTVVVIDLGYNYFVQLREVKKHKKNRLRRKSTNNLIEELHHAAAAAGHSAKVTPVQVLPSQPAGGDDTKSSPAINNNSAAP